MSLIVSHDRVKPVDSQSIEIVAATEGSSGSAAQHPPAAIKMDQVVPPPPDYLPSPPPPPDCGPDVPPSLPSRPAPVSVSEDQPPTSLGQSLKGSDLRFQSTPASVSESNSQKVGGSSLPENNCSTASPTAVRMGDPPQEHDDPMIRGNAAFSEIGPKVPEGLMSTRTIEETEIENVRKAEMVVEDCKIESLREEIADNTDEPINEVPEEWFREASLSEPDSENSPETCRSAVHQGDVEVADGAHTDAQAGEIWQKFWDIHAETGLPTGRCYFWHEPTNEWFFKDDAGAHGWEEFVYDAVGSWWWHNETHRWFIAPT